MAALRWVRTHVITLLGSTIVFVGILLAETWSRDDFIHGDGWYAYTHGWPAVALLRTEYDGSEFSSISPSTRVECEWQTSGLLVDGFVSLLLLVSTATFWEGLRRRRLKPYQFRMSDALAAVLVLAVLLSFHLHEASLYWWYADLTGDLSNCLNGGLWRLPWYVRAPTYAGMACFILLVLRFVSFCASRIAIQIRSPPT